jgi:hypothetical protein
VNAVERSFVNPTKVVLVEPDAIDVEPSVGAEYPVGAATHCTPVPVVESKYPLVPTEPPAVNVPVTVRLEIVGLVPNTSEPEPVSSEIMLASSADVVAARTDNLSVVTTRVLDVGIVVPLTDVAVATPSAGVTSVGLVFITNVVPVPV